MSDTREQGGHTLSVTIELELVEGLLSHKGEVRTCKHLGRSGPLLEAVTRTAGRQLVADIAAVLGARVGRTRVVSDTQNGVDVR